MALGVRRSAYRFRHGAQYKLPQELTLFDSYHCSRYNTQTKRLTKDMFHQVFNGILQYLTKPGTLRISLPGLKIDTKPR